MVQNLTSRWIIIIYDIIVGLYQTALNYRLDDINWPDRDRFIMSKGHASPAIYSILHQLGIISKEDILSFRKLGSVCQGHVDMKWTEGVDFLLEVWGWTILWTWMLLQRKWIRKKEIYGL